jgi:hypothetical protein
MEQAQSSPSALRKVNSTYTAGVWRRRLKKYLRSLLGFEHEGVGAVLPKCARHGAALRRRTVEFLFAASKRFRICDSNLEQGDTVSGWGRLIFHVTEVDAFWTHLKEKGFDPEIPRDASWGERYFHMLDPDGHELSFARPLR